ncbi:hypothetical protein DsansV1_C09g0095171 [Dioscorea sansibarensis]
MSLPGEQQQPPGSYEEPYRHRSGGGSIGPVIAVLAVIAVLGVIAGVIGRLCSGRRVWGCRQYDFEGWIERKCASCIDGRLDHHHHHPRPPPPPAAAAPGSTNGPAASTAGTSSEVKPPEPAPPAPDGGGVTSSNRELGICISGILTSKMTSVGLKGR